MLDIPLQGFPIGRTMNDHRDLDAGRCAIVVLDALPPLLEARPALAAAIAALTAAARAAGSTVCWIKPAGAADATIADILDADPADWVAHKAGISAFAAGNCSLPDWLLAEGLEVVILAGAGAAVAASARDAAAGGFRVVVCTDATAPGPHGEGQAAAEIIARLAR